MPTPPNILYLHSHDTGRGVQPYGHAVRTPAIQQLAREGVLFRQAFCAASTCSGSRACLLTGEHAHQNGMTGLAHRGWVLDDYGRHVVHALRTAGYWSGLIGEQHLSIDPHVIGYDEVIDVPSTHVEDIAPAARGLLARLANERPGAPWFLSVGFFETHRTFFEPASAESERYGAVPEALPDTPATRRDLAAFRSSAETLDAGVADVLAALGEHGFADDTLVVLTTDHGMPFPPAKANLTDLGTGVMLVMRGPGGFQGGRVEDAMVSHLDLYPTWCELAGVDVPPWCEGRSLLPLAAGEVESLHEELFAGITYHAAYEPQRSVRTTRWKYVRRFDERDRPVLANCDDGPSKDELLAAGWAEQRVARERLHDLVFDPQERRNLAGEPAHERTLDDLRSRLDAWMRRTSDPLLDGPVPVPAGACCNRQSARSAEEPVVFADAGARCIT